MNRYASKEYELSNLRSLHAEATESRKLIDLQCSQRKIAQDKEFASLKQDKRDLIDQLAKCHEEWEFKRREGECHLRTLEE